MESAASTTIATVSKGVGRNRCVAKKELTRMGIRL
jgi:hypothetical protein